MIVVSVMCGLIFVYLVFIISPAEFIILFCCILYPSCLVALSHKVLCHLFPDKYYLVDHYRLL